MKNGHKVPEYWEETLSMVEHPRLLVFHPFTTNEPSEADLMQEWRDFLRPFLSENRDIRVQRGECVSESSRMAKEILNNDIGGFGKHGRKSDLLLVAERHELSNVEFKVQNAGPTCFTMQHLKNIRLNRAIMESHFNITRSRGRLLFMDVCGWKGKLHSLYTFRGIHVCRSEYEICLPRNEKDLEVFLRSDSFQHVLLLKRHLDRKLERLTKASKATKATGDSKDSMARDTGATESDFSTPPPESRTKRILSNVHFSPSSREKRMRN
ncbi:hypothetical protein B0O80DRAFT_504581 [Mortierella sp. GBAus27b]|nr:hypothetical protein B0O80DRAFT_504581 [Mortierella sp. GBAus27b]